MARYRVENTIVNTDNAVNSWEEATRWDGRSNISKATGTELDHEKLYKSRKGEILRRAHESAARVKTTCRVGIARGSVSLASSQRSRAA